MSKKNRKNKNKYHGAPTNQNGVFGHTDKETKKYEIHTDEQNGFWSSEPTNIVINNGRLQTQQRNLGIPKIDVELPSKELLEQTISQVNKAPLQETKETIEKVDTNVPLHDKVENNKIHKSIDAYTFGYYNNKTKKCGWSAITCDITEGKNEKYCGALYGPAQAEYGEIRAVLKAVTSAISGGYKKVVVHYQHPGIKSWATGECTTRDSNIKYYIEGMKNAARRIEVVFEKGFAETSVNKKLKQLVDTATSEIDRNEVVGTSKTKSASEIKSGTATGKACRRMIEDFYKKENHTFQDYKTLATFGIDGYEKMECKQLELMAGSLNCTNIRKALKNYGTNTQTYETALRWCIRGLDAQDAAAKAYVERTTDVFEKGYL